MRPVYIILEKLAYETDPSDVNADLENGLRVFVLVDARSKEDFDERHIPGAMNIPYRTITAETTKNLSKDKLVVVYCWGPGCNAATKAAVRLAALGFRAGEGNDRRNRVLGQRRL